MRPDVLMLSAAHPPDDVRIVRREGAALAAAGWRVTHLCPARADMPAACAGVAIQGFARRPGWWARLRHIPQLARLARASGARVIHAHEPDSWAAALLARPARVVLDVHEHYPSRLDARLPRALRPIARAALSAACRAMARRADAVVVAKDGLQADALPVRNYAPDAGVAPRIHTPGPLHLLHIGAISRARGWPQLLAALALARDARLTIAGRFTDNTQDDFLADAGARGLLPRITLAGWLAPDALARLAATADINLILFQPGEENHRLALPHKLADGMLAGLPTIAPAFAEEVARMLRGAEAGLLVDVADPRAIADAIEQLRDPALRARSGTNARRAALQDFSWEGEAEKLRGLYRNLLETTP